jgi:hypothetical protein
MRLLFAIILFFNSIAARATDYYISSSTGSDLYPGTIANPWARPKNFSPGNNYYFLCGDTFYNLNIPQVGTTSATRINMGKYGYGKSPVFSSFSTINSSAWSLYSPNVWVATITNSLYVTGTIPKTANCGMIVVSGVKYGFRAGVITGLNKQWEFYCDFTGGHIFVYSSANPSSSLIGSW